MPGYGKVRSLCWQSRCNGTDTVPAGCFEGTKLCQHGPAECEADSLEACAIDVYPSANVFAPFVTCFEGVHHANLSYVSLCAEEVGIPAAPILECYEDKARVAALDEKAARLTAQSGHQYTPWVVLSNFSGSEKQVLQDPDTLLASVCDIYAAQDGAKVPAGCPAGKPSIVPGYNWLTWQEGATLGAGIGGGLIGSAVIGAIVYCCCKKKRQRADPIMSNPFLPAEGP